MGSKFPLGKDPQDNPFYPLEPQITTMVRYCIVCNHRHTWDLVRRGDDVIWVASCQTQS